MAKVVGGITTSHIPAIGKAISKGLQAEPYWKPFFDGYPPAWSWLQDVKPDVAVVIYNDHGLNFFLNHIPTFAVGAARQYANADSGWGLPVLPPIDGDLEFSWHIIESLVANEFDVSICQEMLVDHGFTVPVSLLWSQTTPWPIRVVPVAVNTVCQPVPSAARCYRLGQALGRAIESYEEDLKVVVVGTGGMSHQLQGERAGFINRDFDLMFMDTLVRDPAALTRLTTTELVAQAGSEGVELIMWLAMRGAMTHNVSKVHSHYHIPVSNTGAGLLVLENAA
jgi:protocatechuate 4,5-dioxygenase beta chain